MSSIKSEKAKKNKTKVLHLDSIIEQVQEAEKIFKEDQMQKEKTEEVVEMPKQRKYVYSNELVRPINFKMDELRDFIVPKIYTITSIPFQGYALKETDSNFTLPKKLYGDIEKKQEKFYDTFNKRAVSTGILLVGEKGSGKSLLAKKICNKAIENGMPVVYVNEDFGDGLQDVLTFIEELPQCVIFVDEFEKIFTKEQQQSWLSLLDGVSNKKKLFIFTANEKWNISSYLENRPGRIYYRVDYNSLPLDVVKEYSNENLLNKNKVEEVLAVYGLFERFNFDMLQSLVEESNRYSKESVLDLLKDLNLKPEFDNYLGSNKQYKVQVFKDSQELFVHPDYKLNTYNPYQTRQVYFRQIAWDLNEDECDSKKIKKVTYNPVSVRIGANNLYKIENNQYHYKAQGYTFIVQEEKQKLAADFFKAY